MSTVFRATLYLLFLLSLGLHAAAETKAPPSEAGQIMIVMDVSGSMRGRVGGRVKMTAAREVLRSLTERWDKHLHLGLTAYGHRRKKDCKDIQVLVPVGPVQASRIRRVVDDLKPLGKTPLSEAVRQAAVALKYTEQKATVILISDGKETCAADPCAVGEELKNAGVDFKAHVIGFAVKKEEQKGLQCLAERTGGTFYDAKNASDLNEALSATVEQVKKETGPKLRFNVVLRKGDEPLKRGFYAEGLKWRFFATDETGTKTGRPLHQESGAAAAVDLAAGNYVAELKWDAAQVTFPFSVEEDVRAQHTVNLKAGILSLSAILSQGQPPLKGQVGWTYYKSDADGKRGAKLIYRGGPKPQTVLPAGEGLVTAKFDSASRSMKFTLAEGERREEQIVLQAGAVTLRAVDARGADVRGYQTWTILRRDSGGSEKAAAFKSGSSPKFVLAAGRYIAELRFQKRKFKSEFDVIEGESREQKIEVPDK